MSFNVGDRVELNAPQGSLRTRAPNRKPILGTVTSSQEGSLHVRVRWDGKEGAIIYRVDWLKPASPSA
jgi:ribosomal protein L21E